MIVGVDVGGTSIKIGLVQGRRIRFFKVLPTARWANPTKMEQGLAEAIRSLTAERKVRLRGVGVGIPGLVRYSQGIVDSCANLAGWNGVPLQSRLRRRLGVPVCVDNDVHAMTLAEWRYGAGRGSRNLLCLTLGTGVGGGLVLDGRLYRSRFGYAAEIGHMPIGEEGRRCSCGGRACLERYVGNRDLLREVRQRLRSGQKSILRKLVKGDLSKVTPELIDQACARGDRFARETWRRAGERIGLVLVDAIHLVCPDRIVIGGGLAKAGRWLLDPIRRTVRARSMRDLPSIPIVPARLGSSAGVVGAALLVGQAHRAGSRR